MTVETVLYSFTGTDGANPYAGVYVERIALRDGHGNDVQDIPLDHPGLTKGWWAVEGDRRALRRWTDGDAVLPLPLMDGPSMLEVRTSPGALVYLVGGEELRLVA